MYKVQKNRKQLAVRLFAFFLCSALLSLNLAAQAKTKTIVDMAGRTVMVPIKVEKAFSSNPIGTVSVFTLNPAKVAAVNGKLSAAEKEFLPLDYQKLPAWGSWSGSLGSVNLENIIAGAPDIIFASPIDPGQIAVSEQIQEKTGIPVVMLDQSLEKLPEMYRLVGALIGEEKRADQLAAYAQKLLDDTKLLVQKVPLAKRPKVYYAEGNDGLQTDPKGSFHTEVLDYLGGLNVAEVSVKSEQGIIGRSSVSLEQVLAWSPDYIIASDNPLAGGGFYAKILKDPSWQGLPAVKNGKTVLIPSYPWDWFDRPPSVNRLIGLKWLAKVLYPELAKYDLKKETKDFYEIFYRYTLNDEQVNKILQDALPWK